MLSKHCLAKKHSYQTKQTNTLFELKQYYSKYIQHYFLGMQDFSSKCLSLRHDMIGSKNSVFGPVPLPLYNCNNFAMADDFINPIFHRKILEDLQKDANSGGAI